MFNPKAFLNQTVSGTLDTVRQVIPAGEYDAVIDDKDFDVENITKEGSGKPPAYVMRLYWVILNEEVKAKLDRDRVVVKQDVFLDFLQDGTLDLGKGKNVDLGKIRAAVGQNDGGPWMPSNLRGAGPARIKVTHQANPNSPEEPYVKVSSVIRLT